jgi:hypothetical protein
MEEVRAALFRVVDPSGIDIPRKVVDDLRALAPDTDLRFERVAVNENQIAAWSEFARLI